MAEIGELKAKITADILSYEQAVEKVKRKTNDLQTTAQKAEVSFQGLNTALSKLGVSHEYITKINDTLRKANPKILEQQLEQVRKELVNLGANSKEIDKITKEIMKANSGAAMLEVTTRDLGMAFSTLSVAMATVVTKSVQIAANFEQEMAKVKSVTMATGVEFDALRNKAAELGATTAFSASQAAQGMFELATAGFKTDDIINALPAVMNGATAAQIELAQAAEITSSILNGFGLETTETTKLMDILTKASVDSNSGLVDLGYAMKYVGPLAKSLGITVEEATSAISLLSNAGIKGESAGTALRGALAQLLNPAKENAELMDALGISITTSEGKMKSLSEIIDSFRNALNGMAEADRNAAIAKIIGTEAASGFLVLMDAGKEQIDAFSDSLRNSAGITNEIAEIQKNTLKGAIDELKSSLEAVGITVGDSFAPMIRGVAEDLTKLALGFEGLDNPTQQAIITFTTLTPLIGSVVVSIYALRTALVALEVSVPILAAVSLVFGGLAAAYAFTKTKADEAKLSQEQYTQRIEESATKANNLANEYDTLANKLKTVSSDTDGAKAAKERMAEIMSELQRLSPGIVQGYDNETGAIRTMRGEVNSLTEALRRNTIEKMSNAKAAIADLNTRLSTVQGRRVSLIKEQKNYSSDKIRTINAEIMKEESTVRKQIDALTKIYDGLDKSLKNQDLLDFKIENDPPPVTTGGTKRLSDYISDSSAGKKSSENKKTIEDIAKEQYQSSLRWIQYKKNLTQMSVEDELAAYERLLIRYKQYNDIRMEMEEKIYQTKGVLTQNSFENSSEWIEKEEMRMRLSGKTDQEVAQMKIDAWERVRSRYAANTEYYKQADRELYNIRIQIMREAEQELKELDREREDAYKELKSTIIDSVKDAERAELDSIRKRKDAELDALREREDAELDSLSRRKQAIEDFYSDQVESIEDEKTAEDKKKILDDIEKYKYATSKEGREKYNDLLAELRELERKEEKDALDKEKRDKLRALEDEERDIKDSYKNREREISNNYEKIYNDTQSHFDNLISAMESYTGDAEGFERMLSDSRISLNAEANSQILQQIRSFVNDYNAEMSRINTKSDEIRERVNESITDSNPPSNSNNNSGGSNTPGSGNSKKEFTGWSMYDGSIKYSVDKNGYIFKNGNFVPAENYKWIPQEVIDKARNVKKGIYHTGRDGMTGLNFSVADQLLPDEIAAILQDREYVFQPKQLDSLLGAVRGGGQVINNNYNAPLIAHDGDVRLEDDTDVRTYWRERELAAQRLLAGGERL